MFDIGFMELLLIGIVALLVLGPDKLPGAIRTGALWFGRAKRSFNNVKSEIEQQINADEIRRQLHNESILGDIEKAKKNADKLIKDTRTEIKNTEDSLKRSVSDRARTGTTTAKVTTSADEGIPTPPPDNYKVPSKTDTTPTPEEAEASRPQTTDAPATDQSSPDAQSTSGAVLEEKAGVSVESTAQTGIKTEPTPEPRQSREDSASSRDIYSTPPSGIVSMQNGKFSAANDKPKDSDSSSGKN